MFNFNNLKNLGCSPFNLLKTSNLGLRAQFCTGKEVIEQNVKKNDYFEKEREISVFEAFGPKKKKFTAWNKYNPMTVTMDTIYELRNRKKKEAEIFKQRFINRRHEVLGSDLATAHFVVYRYGKVKFKGYENWIQLPDDDDICEELPTKFVRNLFLEAIDASNTIIRYEGLENFIKLSQLKWLNFSKCIHVDDWFVDRISGEMNESLEYLDISDCHNVTKNCISCFYRFKKLKMLVMRNIVKTKEFEYSCMLLEDAFPNLVIDTRNTELKEID